MNIKQGGVYICHHGYLWIPIFTRNGNCIGFCHINTNMSINKGPGNFDNIEDMDLKTMTLLTDKIDWHWLDKLIMDTFNETPE